MLTVRNPVNATGNPTYSYVYDENGSRLSMTDANLKTWTFTYDAKNRQLTGKRPLVDPNDKPYRMEYDAANQLLKSSSPTGRTMRYTYDQRGGAAADSNWLRQHQSSGDGKLATRDYALNAEDRKSLTDELARKVRCSPRRLRDLFVANVGMTPERYFKQMKLKRAKELIETTKLKACQITETVGLTDYGHFLRDFKVTYGLTVKQRRKQIMAAAN